jgi:hypothetical protein
VVTAVVEFVAAVFGFFVLLVGLNGFSERQATPSLIFYIVFCLVSSLVISFLGTVAAKTIVKKQWLGKAVTAVVSILFTSMIGVVFVVVAVFASFILAEFLRKTG